MELAILGLIFTIFIITPEGQLIAALVLLPIIGILYIITCIKDSFKSKKDTEKQKAKDKIINKIEITSQSLVNENKKTENKELEKATETLVELMTYKKIYNELIQSITRGISRRRILENINVDDYLSKEYRWGETVIYLGDHTKDKEKNFLLKCKENEIIQLKKIENFLIEKGIYNGRDENEKNMTHIFYTTLNFYILVHYLYIKNYPIKIIAMYKILN